MKFYINITFSKLMAFLILSAGTTYSILTEEANVIILAITVAGGIVGWRQQKQKEIKTYEKKHS